MTVATSDLAKVLRSKKPILLPDDPLRSNINKLCDVFEASVQDIIVKIPKPPLADSTDYLNFQDPVPPPRVTDRTNQNATIVSENQIEFTAPSPRVEKIPTVPCKDISPRVECNTKLYDAQSARPKQNEEPSFYVIQPINRHPARLKVAKTASSM